LDSDFGRSGCTRCRWLATVCVDAVDSLGESPIDIGEHQPVNVPRAIRGASRILGLLQCAVSQQFASRIEIEPGTEASCVIIHEEVVHSRFEDIYIGEYGISYRLLVGKLIYELR